MLDPDSNSVVSVLPYLALEHTQQQSQRLKKKNDVPGIPPDYLLCTGHVLLLSGLDGSTEEELMAGLQMGVSEAWTRHNLVEEQRVR